MNVRHSQRLLQPALREQVIYANDMQYGNSTKLSRVGGLSPCWVMVPDSDVYVYADLKVPIDRVPGTPIVLKPVFVMSQGGGRVEAYVGVTVVGEGDDVSVVAPITGWLRTGMNAPPANVQATMPGVTVQAPWIDGRLPSCDLQLKIGRWGGFATDTADGTLYLIKVVAEYTAYV